jgi:hypothetical protein
MANSRKKTTSKKKHELPLDNQTSTEKLSTSKIDQALVDQLLTQVASRYRNELLADKKLKLKEISHISSMAEEYFTCYALIGYSIQNEQVVVLNMPTPKDEAALVDLLRSTFIDIASNRP